MLLPRARSWEICSASCWAPRGGYRILARYGRFLRLDERKLKLGLYFFLKYGGMIVVLGRFLLVSRTSEAFLAGVNKMGWVRFLLFTVVRRRDLGDGYRVGSLVGDLQDFEVDEL